MSESTLANFVSDLAKSINNLDRSHYNSDASDTIKAKLYTLPREIHDQVLSYLPLDKVVDMRKVRECRIKYLSQWFSDSVGLLFHMMINDCGLTKSRAYGWRQPSPQIFEENFNELCLTPMISTFVELFQSSFIPLIAFFGIFSYNVLNNFE